MNTLACQTAEQWNKLTHRVLALEELPLETIQAVLKDSYAVLTHYHKAEAIPKSVAKLLLEMNDFLSFTAMMEEREQPLGFYHWQEIFAMVSSMKQGFFEGKYSHAFPVLEITDALDNSYLMNLQTDPLAAYFALYNRQKTQEL